MDKVYINLNKVDKSFENGFKLLIDHLQLTNKRYYLTGDNGSGKSVFLKLISKVDQDYKGMIENNAQNILFLTNDEINYEFLTLQENITLFYGIYNLKPNWEVIASIYDNHQLNDLARISSLGTKLKTGISLIFQADFWDLIILDETLSAVDQKTITIIDQELNKRASEGSIVIFTSHTEKLHLNYDVNLMIDKGVIYEKKN